MPTEGDAFVHVLIVPSWYPTPDNPINGIFFREQALALQNAGHRIGVIYPQLRSLRDWRTLIGGTFGITLESDAGVPTLRSHGMNWFPRHETASRWWWVRHGLRLYADYAKRYGHPDIIHVHSMLNAGVLAVNIQRRHGVPFVVTEHFTGYARGLVRGRPLRLARRVATHAAHRFAVSQPFATLLEGIVGTASGAWEPMPNIVNRRFVEEPLRRTDGHIAHFRFLNVALLAEKKGVHHLIDAFARAFGDDANVTLEIVGDGSERPRLEALARDLGVADRITFLGVLSRDDVVDAMSRADGFVLPSLYETFGVVVIEALALGKPVVATRCGGPEAIVRPEDGLLVPAGDVGALAEAMARLRANHAQYDPETIRASCIARFGEQAVVGRLTLAYEAIRASVERS